MNPSYIECLMIVAAVSLEVFMIAEYEGSNMKILNAGKTALVLLVFFAGQLISYGVGYLLSTRAPLFVRVNDSAIYHNVVYVLAALLLLIIGSYSVYRMLKREQVEEKLQEVNYRRIAGEAAFGAIFTCLAGMSSGFLKMRFMPGFITIILATFAAVILGLYSGYYQGYRFRRVIFGCSSALLVGTGIEILVRYI